MSKSAPPFQAFFRPLKTHPLYHILPFLSSLHDTYDFRMLDIRKEAYFSHFRCKLLLTNSFIYDTFVSSFQQFLSEKEDF